MLRLSLVALLATLPCVAAEPPAWWSLRPMTRTTPPFSRDAKRSAHPVDAFILKTLGDNGLSLAPPADRRALLRRVTFDLTGLPPTPEELAAFEKDAAPDAYEKLVDRLLASPAYGERQARMWMDVVHFAETHGHDQDRVRPNAWRYRDYLIRSFNADTPYSHFIQEQIAADVLFPDQPHLTAALGFLAAGPWDESSLRDIRDDSIDRQIGYYLDRDDIVTTVMSTFQGLTVQCARCHDHKFDPISQHDYYRLQAVFAGVGRGDVSYDADPATVAKRNELTARLAALEKPDAAPDSPEVRKVVAAWEARHRGDGVAWRVPTFAKIAAEKGSTLAPQKDGSIRAEGTRPETDTYVLTTTAAEKVTAVRLELLPDESLPHRGPGRQDNGNLHLSEFKLSTSAGPVALRTPTSDYDQPGWTVAHATDGDPKTAWGIYPQVGKPHEGVFELKEPRSGELTIRLEQLHGGGHLIGRFRLSFTTSPLPVRVSKLSPALTTILATPSEKRSASQVRELAAHVLREQFTSELGALPAPVSVYAAAPSFAPDGGHKPVPAPRPVHMLKRGDIRRPGEKVEPGTVAGLPFTLKNATEGERRAALARSITDPANPLTWRVMANRIWQQHFGRGIVDSPNDFGKMGQQPTHPELLDWLAADLREHQSLKRLHRLIVTSTTYRQSSRHDAKAAALDADNKLLWRMPRSRLDAEQTRDAILQVSGRLDRTPGGPSDRQFDLKPGIHVTPLVDYGKFDWDRPQGHRRSVYRFVFRTLPDPLVDCLDGADASQLTAKRTESVTAPQALALLNNEFVLVHARAFAARLEKHSPKRAEQIALACRLVWGRSPTAVEAKAFAAHAEKHGLPNLCRVLFNSNEFLFLD